MKLALIAVAFVALVGFSSLTGVSLVKAGPATQDQSIWYHGGGGGP